MRLIKEGESVHTLTVKLYNLPPYYVPSYHPVWPFQQYVRYGISKVIHVNKNRGIFASCFSKKLFKSCWEKFPDVKPGWAGFRRGCRESFSFQKSGKASVHLSPYLYHRLNSKTRIEQHKHPPPSHSPCIVISLSFENLK